MPHPFPSFHWRPGSGPDAPADYFPGWLKLQRTDTVRRIVLTSLLVAHERGVLPDVIETRQGDTPTGVVVREIARALSVQLHGWWPR